MVRNFTNIHHVGLALLLADRRTKGLTLNTLRTGDADLRF